MSADEIRQSQSLPAVAVAGLRRWSPTIEHGHALHPEDDSPAMAETTDGDYILLSDHLAALQADAREKGEAVPAAWLYEFPFDPDEGTDHSLSPIRVLESWVSHKGATETALYRADVVANLRREIALLASVADKFRLQNKELERQLDLATQPAQASEQEEVAREPAPSNSLPDYMDCRRIIDNWEFEQRALAGLEGAYIQSQDGPAREPTALERFIHEYDDADSYRSEWFMHRLELVVNEAKATHPQPVPSFEVFAKAFRATLDPHPPSRDGSPVPRYKFVHTNELWKAWCLAHGIELDAALNQRGGGA